MGNLHLNNMHDYILNIIKIHGFIPLDEFISLALCHPRRGYYAKQNPILRDFITAPEISNAFGIIFASYIIDKILPISNDAREVNFVEFGGGTGKFAFDILNFIISLEKINNHKIKKLIPKIKFNSIEFSEHLTEMQKSTIKSITMEKSFFKNISEFKESKKNIINNKENIFVFFSNEFFDSLPIKQFIKNEDDFCEIVVTTKNNSSNDFIYEQIKINSDNIELIPKYFQNNKNDFFEIPLTTIEILNNIVDIMNNSRSIFLTADYGFMENPNTSTLQGIYEGRKIKDILKNVGNADITHLVNFPLFQSLFAKNNIRSEIFKQGVFLVEHGIKSLITPENLIGIERLIAPEKMGDLFKVLIAKSF